MKYIPNKKSKNIIVQLFFIEKTDKAPLMFMGSYAIWEQFQLFI